MTFNDITHWLSTVENPLIQALIAGIFTWGLTAVGATVVFFFKQLHRSVLDTMLGFAGGVMVAASFWSLLDPAIKMAAAGGATAWLPAAIGFSVGALFLFMLDKLMPHLHLNFSDSEKEGLSTRWHRTTLLVLAITLHNIPEGLAVGVIFGGINAGVEGATLSSAVVLAIGIGIQNLPEGIAVAMPLRRMGVSRFRSFWFGQLSAIVEPIAAVLGAWAVASFLPFLPYALSFAAGAMIYVVVEEVIPESQRDKYTDQATLGVIFGFVVMMILDVALG